MTWGGRRGNKEKKLLRFLLEKGRDSPEKKNEERESKKIRLQISAPGPPIINGRPLG